MQEDVCVVGGGPSGLVAALALRREGFSVTLADCAVPAIDKACGEGLMPDSLATLRRLGIELDESLGFAFKGVQFSDGEATVSGDFRHGKGLGLRRHLLHQVLVGHAEKAGVKLHWGAKNVRLTAHGIAIQGQEIQARLVVGADGVQSGVRRSAGLDAIKSERRRYGFRRHYRTAPWSEYVELYWGRRGQFYVTPVAENEICVVFISRDPHLRLDEALREFPLLARRLDGVEHGSHEMGALSVSRTLKRVYKDGLALVGDASGSVDVVTGEGMCLAFRQAEALAQAVRKGDLGVYGAVHHKAGSRARLMANLMLSMEWHSEVQRRALKSLAKRPQLFEWLLSFHVGEVLTPKAFSPRMLLGFGFDFLTA